MKVKDWLSVINVDDSDWFEVKILDDDYYCLKIFERDELEKLIKRYGENQIKDANIIVGGNYDDYNFKIELCLDVKHIPSEENPFE